MPIKLFFLFVLKEFAESSDDVNALAEYILDDMIEVVKNEDGDAEGDEHEKASSSYLCKALNHDISLFCVKSAIWRNINSALNFVLLEDIQISAYCCLKVDLVFIWYNGGGRSKDVQ